MTGTTARLDAYAAPNEAATDMFRRLGDCALVFADPGSFAALTGLSPDQADAAARALAESGLVEITASEYELTAASRVYARSQARPRAGLIGYDGYGPPGGVLGYFLDDGDTGRHSATLLDLAQALRPSHPAQAHEINQRAEDHARQVGDLHTVADAITAQGLDLLAADLPDLAEMVFQLAEKHQQLEADTPGIARARTGLALIALHQGDPARAAALLDTAHRLLAAIEDRHAAALVRAEHARALAKLGRTRDALTELDHALTALQTLRSTCHATALAIQANVLAQGGFHVQARQARAEARAPRRGTEPSLDATIPAPGDG